MPKVRRGKQKPPEGWELIAPTIEELDRKMRDGSFSSIHSHNLPLFCFLQCFFCLSCCMGRL
jgi:hypothetical protein